MAEMQRTGKRKIEIKEITQKNRKQVTFTKRRKGLFNKGAELYLLTGAPVAFIVVSPGGKAFSFGQPSVQAVLDAYRSGAAAAAVKPPEVGLLDRIGDLEGRIEAARGKKGGEQGFWWDRIDVSKCKGVGELQELKEDLVNLRRNLWARQRELQNAKEHCAGLECEEDGCLQLSDDFGDLAQIFTMADSPDLSPLMN